MSASWKTIRVFISSTFRDMQAERDHLVRFVFPKLRQVLLQRRIHLVDVDLRWGVTSEQDALSVCREVVDECRPRFLCVLGSRYGWVPPDKTRSITADEVYYGVLDRNLTSRGFAYFYFRDPSATEAMVEVTLGEFREPTGSYGAVALADLKTVIIEAGLQQFIYRAQWDNQSRRLIGLKEFGDRVYADLKQSIDQEFGAATGEKPDEFTEENAAMEAFIEERVQRFVLGSRQPIWNELRHHAESTGGNGYLCLTGAAGSGKSALLGKFCQDYREAHPQDLVIAHFVGASPGSTDVRRTLRRLCHELVIGAALTAEIPEDPEKLRVAFAEILQQASAKKRVVILLDAINQFDSSTQLSGWSWLPEELPATARIILSTLSGPALDSLRQRRQPPRLVELHLLDGHDREAIIKEFLHRYRKCMTDDQRAALMAKADAGTPLYLLVALEELRTLGTYEEITDRIEQLPPDTRALFIWILKRLEDDDDFRDASGRKIGRELVSRFVSLLGASRHGLSQQEIVELLLPNDPQGNVAALAQLLRSYLMQRGELLDFYHGQFREAVEQAYLAGDDNKQKAHDQLATYFRHQADPEKNQSWKGDSPRPFLEVTFHLVEAQRTDDYCQTLCDLRFVEARCRVVQVFELIADYRIAQENLQEVREDTAQDHHQQERAARWPQERLSESAGIVAKQRQAIAQFSRFVRCRSHLLARRPDLTVTEAFNFSAVGPVPDGAETLLNTPRYARHVWLRRINRSIEPIDRCLLTLTGHRNWVCAVAITPDSRFVITASDDSTVKQWDIATGRCVQTLEAEGGVHSFALLPEGEKVVIGTVDKVEIRDLKTGVNRQSFKNDLAACESIAVTNDGALAVTGWDDGSVLLWNLRAEDESLYGWDRHAGRICAAAVTTDGQKAVTGSWDKTAKVWDLKTGECLQTLLGHNAEIGAVAITPDGLRVITGSWDDTVKVWNIATGTCLCTLRGHTNHVCSVVVTSDGQFVVTGSADQTVKIWDLATERCRMTLRGHTETVGALAVMPDGSHLITGSHDHTAKLWSVAANVDGSITEANSGRITAMALIPTLFQIATGSSDRTIRVWGLDSGICLHTLAGHADEVEGISATPDGRHLVSAGRDKCIKIWDVRSNSCLETLKGDVERVHAIAITPNGELAVLGSYQHKTVWLLGLHWGNAIRPLHGHGGPVYAVAVTPDGRIALTGGEDQTVILWDLETMQFRQAMIGHMGSVWAVIVTPDGRNAVTGSWDKTIKMWDLDNGGCIRTFKGHTGWVESLAVTPDGRYVVSGSTDETVRVWNLKTGDCVWKFEGHQGRVWRVTVTPDARYALTGGYHDSALKIWDLETGKEVGCYFVEGQALTLVCGLHDARIAVGDGYGSVHVLKLEGVVSRPSVVTAWEWPLGRGLSFGCPYCGTWSEVVKSDPSMESICPNCSRAIMLNSFTIEADWRPIAKAWTDD